MTLTPLLAAPDPGTWITLIFVILGFLGWIMNLAGNKNPPPPVRGGRPPGQPPRPMPRNRDERIQSEIDIFLQEVGARKGDQPPAPVAGEDRPRPPRPPLRREPTAPAAEAPPPVRVVDVPPPAETERRRLVGRQIGSNVREHVTQSLEHAQLEPHVRAHVAGLVERAVEHQVGRLGHEEVNRLADKAATQHSAAAVHPLVRLLRDPQGLRQAVLVSEILGPPPSLRGG